MDSLRDLLRHLYQERPPSPSQNCQSVQCDLTYFQLAVLFGQLLDTIELSSYRVGLYPYIRQ